jgi:uncharacterized protein (UPF0332 family)
LHRDLFQQARELATRDRRKPRQVNLRRAVSSAYYAMFHGLIEAACRLMLGARHDERAVRYVLGRAFTHSTMKQACAAFASGKLKAKVAKGLPAAFSIPLEIREVAQAFNYIQDQRQLAEYDRTENYHRSDVLALIDQGEAAWDLLENLALSMEKKFFLVCLLAWSNLAGR